MDFPTAPVYVGIDYEKRPWWSVALREGVIDGVALLNQKKPRLFQSETRRGSWWKRVRQLAFQIQRDEMHEVLDFYREFGPVLPRTKRMEERLEDVKLWVEWFLQLTNIVKWVKSGRDSPLWGLFGPPRRLSGHEPLEKPIHTDNLRSLAVMYYTLIVNEWTSISASYEYLHGGPEWPFIRYKPQRGRVLLDTVPAALRDVSFEDFQDVFVSLASSDNPNCGIEIGWLSPQSKDELFAAAWEAASESVQRFMKGIPFVPAVVQHLDEAAPVIGFQWRPDGALQAAFLQWFMQEVATVEAKTCKADGCANLVFRGETGQVRDYCSDKCRMRESQRRQRARDRDKEATARILFDGSWSVERVAQELKVSPNKVHRWFERWSKQS